MNEGEVWTVEHGASRELSIRQFPSQTTATFYLILFVFLGAALAASIGPSPVCMTPVLLSLLLMPVRAVLAVPRRELALEDQEAAAALKLNGAYQRVQEAIDGLAAEVGFRRPIRLIVSRRPNEARASGSWRRHYLLLGAELLEKVARDLGDAAQRDKAQALLLHEIGHHLHRDVQRIGYAGELLKSCATLLPWWTFFLIGWLGLALLMGEAILEVDIQSVTGLTPELQELLAPLLTLSPEEAAEVRSRLESVSAGLLLSFLLNAFFPIAVTGLVLWLFFWRRMLRLQEFYADALVAAQGLGWAELGAAIARYGYSVRPAPPAQPGLGNAIRRALVGRLARFGAEPGETTAFIGTPDRWGWRSRRWLSLHPTLRERRLLWLEPQLFLEEWPGVAWATAVLVLTLDVMLVNPLTGYHLSAHPVHISTIGIFLLVSAWLMPMLALNRPFWRPLGKLLLIVFGLRWAWLALNVALLLTLATLAPAFTQELLNLTVLSTARSVVVPETVVVGDPLQMSLAILPALFGLQLVQLGGVLLLLALYTLFQRGVAQHARAADWIKRHWLLVVGLAVIVGALFVTPLSDLVGGRGAMLVTTRRMMLYTGALLVGFVVWLQLRRLRLVADE